MPLQATSGAASYDAFGGGVAATPQYIEDVFSTWLYTGNSSTQTIANGIDLAGKGGLVWIKSRSTVNSNVLFDTQRGALNQIQSSAINASVSSANSLTAFNSTGFSLGTDPSNQFVNFSGVTYASWTFREQAKFFDVVTYTGTGANRTVAHNLGSVPGCIFVKRTDTTGAWQVYHRSNANTEYMVLNSSAARATGATRWNSTTPTSTEFSLGTDATVNASGGTYVAYIFAHNAGGFGLTGTDNVITCGSYTATGAGMTIDVGYEPQLVLIKSASSGVTHWGLYDTMRGLNVQSDSWTLFPSLADAETTSGGGVEVRLTNRGFSIAAAGSNYDSAGVTYIYMTIRRGPMRVPTNGTSVLGLNARTGTGATTTVTDGTGVTDFAIIKNRGSTFNWTWATRLTDSGYLASNATTAQAGDFAAIPARPWTVMNGVTVGTTSNLTNASGDTFINYLIDRAPGFMDIACYTGTGANVSRSHNLGVAPELWIVKRRDSPSSWQVGSTALANTEYLVLESSVVKATGATRWNSTYPTASVFTTGTDTSVNVNGGTYIAYFFATCLGVSKVGSYTGTGATQTINCGFTGGARFLLIKRTDSTGDWLVWDSARGIVAGNDLYLRINSNGIDTSGADWVDPAATGFELSNAVGNVANTSGGTYIFLAIA
jgi:hypothetical protein